MARVLLVDDHRDLAEVMSHLLSAHGHLVECCDSAEAALRAIENQPPQAVIVDQRLPGMSGIDLIRNLRQQGTLGKAPILLCSADDSNEAEAMAVGAYEFWVKGSATLFDKIERLGAALAREHA